MKFSHKVVATSSAILLAALSLLSINQYYNTKQSIESHITQSTKAIISGVSNTVNAELSSSMSLAGYVASLVSDDLNMDSIHNVIDKPVVKQSFVLTGLGFEQDGSYTSNDPNWDPGANWEPRARPWYIDSKQARDTIITAPYSDAVTKELLVSIASPLMVNNRFEGAIFFDMSLASLAELVNKVNLFDAGYLFIVSENGTVIAHPEKSYDGKPMSEFLGDSPISTQTANIELNGNPTQLSFSKIDGLDWYIGAVLDENRAFATVSELRTESIIYSVIALVAGIAALLLVIKMLMKPLAQLNNTLEDVATGQGDLTQRLSTNADEEFASLAKGFNGFTEKLQQLIIESKSLSKGILAGSEQTAIGAHQSAVAVSSQLKELDQLATAMHEMAATSGEVANNAQNAASAAQQADEATKDGTLLVSHTATAITELSGQIEQAVDVVRQLEQSTTNIESILKVINEIADQTNLLALNAAIEAARAGDSGRGFAVVADEVRTLAQRTQQSTTEIRQMIEQLQEGAQSAVSVMGQSQHTASTTVAKSQEADEALVKISDAIQQINDMNLQIASAAEEQSLVAEEINTNTLNIKELSVEVATAAKEAESALKAQTDNVRQQDQILSKFIV
ncbi:methyl-accepting chemotaxis protein [Photobacterium sanctipauli]|uniref:Methyl-accepting chemotaxis protein n=1 Tax=Photobacterium sanctipauli TaxID=1342794 RepID=A0A2T3NPI4_9GAMM|nr:methyl-accepting chemotaxis protein [Photobacterium sanctipauli]PSW18179.1 methyl-accepting chemotaxis protein [Photobacterium sanctipauli]